MTDEWYLPGSKWWKFDFHTHTPKSNDYGHGDESFKNIKPEEWLRKAMESGLDCVAVTDHNAGGWIDELKAKNKELRECGTRSVWYKELTIFPGVEITVGDSGRRVHCWIFLTQAATAKRRTAFWGVRNHFRPWHDRTSTTKSFIDTVQIITRKAGLPSPPTRRFKIC